MKGTFCSASRSFNQEMLGLRSCWKALHTCAGQLSQFSLLSSCCITRKDTRQERHFRRVQESMFWSQRHLDESNIKVKVCLIRPNKPLFAILFHSATIWTYTVIHSHGYKSTELVESLASSDFFFFPHHLLFALHSNSNGMQTWRARELGSNCTMVKKISGAFPQALLAAPNRAMPHRFAFPLLVQTSRARDGLPPE